MTSGGGFEVMRVLRKISQEGKTFLPADGLTGGMV
jgi:hypothetical protein